MPKKELPKNFKLRINWRKAAQQLKMYRLSCLRMEDEYYELVKRYPGQWAGICGSRTVIAPTLDQVIEVLGDDAPHSVIKRLTVSRRKLILTKAA